MKLHVDDVKSLMIYVSDMCLQSREGGKNLELIKSSTTPDPGYRMGKWRIHKKTSDTGEPRSSPFHSRWAQGCMTQTRQYSKDKCKIKKNPQKKYRLGMVSKKITRGLKLVSRYQPHSSFWCGSRHIDVWFAWKTPNLSMNHLRVHINQDIKGDKTKIRTQQYIQLNTRA